MNSLTLYGPERGDGSFQQVARGMQRASLAPLVPTDDASSGEGFLRSRLAVAIGPGHALELAHRLGAHEEHWLLLAPNGERLPDGALGYLTEGSSVLSRGFLTGGLLAPSRWAVDVLLSELDRAGVSRPVVYCPHGVDETVYRPSAASSTARREAYARGEFQVWHFTSTETDRKGTKELLTAWKQALAAKTVPETSRLIVVMNPIHLNRIRWWLAELDLPDGGVSLLPGGGYSAETVAAWMQQAHFLCQPSRGEGFGLTPLEALACGTPVIATAATGHSEYLSGSAAAAASQGAVLVETGPSAPLNDFPGSRAPTVTVDAVRASLERGYRDWTGLSCLAEATAPAVGAEWSWTKRCREGVQALLSRT